MFVGLLGLDADRSEHVDLRGGMLGRFGNDAESSVVRGVVGDCCQIGGGPRLGRNRWVLVDPDEGHVRSESFALFRKGVVESADVPDRPRHVLGVARVPGEVAWQNGAREIWFVLVGHPFHHLLLDVLRNRLSIPRHIRISALDCQ